MPDTPVTSRDVAIYTATPSVKVDNQSNATVNAQLVAMEMRESTGGLTSMELRFGNFGTFGSGTPDYVFEDDAVLKLGAVIEVFGGDATSPTTLFKGRISAIEGLYSPDKAPELVVLGEDALQAARLKRRTKVHENVTLGDLLSSVADTCSLTPRSDGLSTNAGTHVQFNESDLAFVRRIFARYDADLQVVNDELHGAPLSQTRRNQIELTLNGKMRQARVTADLAHQVTKIEISGWDFQQGQVASGTRDDNPPGPGIGPRRVGDSPADVRRARRAARQDFRARRRRGAGGGGRRVGAAKPPLRHAARDHGRQPESARRFARQGQRTR